MAVTGQLWYLGQGGSTDTRLSYVNNDGTNHTVFIDNSPTLDLGTNFPQHVAIDWAAGLYYVISNSGPGGDGATVLMGHLGSAAAPTVVFTPPGNDGAGSDLVNTIQINPYTHHLYVGICDGFGDTPSFQGIRDFTYDVTTGALTAVPTNGGYLVNQNQANIQSSTGDGLDLADPFDLAIDPDTGFLFFTQLLLFDGVEHNSLWRVDLNNPTAPAFQLVPQAQFPLDLPGTNGPNGFLYDVEIDRVTDLVYFTTQSLQPFGFSGYDAADNQIYFISETANGSTNATALTITGLPAGNHFYPGNMTFDQLNRRIYVESEEGGSGSADEVIYVLQLDGAGSSATLIDTITPSPAFSATDANLGGMTFDALATIGTLTGTSTHPVEQGTGVDLIAAPTIADADGAHLASAAVVISGSFAGSGDDLYVLDGAVHRTSGIFGSTNITVTRTTDGSGNQTLTLTGYDTLANYQAVLNAATFATSGDNPTNYGGNITRTVTWQVNDGAVGNPSGTVDGTTTNVRTTTITIDAVNDSPVNNALTDQTTAEDTPKAITFSVSDVDADPANEDITVRLQVAHGTLDVDTSVSAGLAVAGDNTNDVLLTGTQAEINATLAAASGLVYHSALDYHGPDTLTVTTSDLGHTGSPGAQSDIDTVNITVTAVADIANDAASFAEDSGAASILVLGNDTFEGTPAITATTNGAHGTVTVNNNGTPGNTADDFVVYTQDADFNGTDTFTYTVTSGGATETGTVGVTISAVADIAGDTASTNEDTPANILVQGNDTFENPAHAITATSNGAHGTVAVNNNGTPGNTADDFVVYTAGADFNGTDAFTYTVTSGGVTETATVGVTIAAVADIVNDNATVVQDSGGNNLDLLANDTFENPGRSITAVGAAAHGTTAINNNGTPGNTADDFVVYAPASGYSGPDTFTYTVTSNGTTETATVSVTVTPLSTTPTPGNDNITGTNGTDIIFALAGNDVVNGLGGADLLFGNQDNDTISGGAESDLVSGGQGDDSISGGTDGDVLFGNEGKDTIDGNEGTDLILGGQDNNSILGGSGNDTIWGNEGNDTLAGGSGADRFVYLLLEGNDQINGFVFGEGDRLDLEGQSYTTGTSGDGDVLLTLQRGGTVELNGIAPGSFSPSFVV